MLSLVGQATLALLLVCIPFGAADRDLTPSASETEMRADVERILSFPHGLRRLSAEDQEILEQVLRARIAYEPVLLRTFYDLMAAGNYRQALAAAKLMQELDAVVAIGMLGDIFVAGRADLDALNQGHNQEEEVRAKISALKLAEASALSVLGHIGQPDPRVTAKVLESLPETDTLGQRQAYLSYLTRTQAGNTPFCTSCVSCMREEDRSTMTRSSARR